MFKNKDFSHKISIKLSLTRRAVANFVLIKFYPTFEKFPII